MAEAIGDRADREPARAPATWSGSDAKQRAASRSALPARVMDRLIGRALGGG